MNAEQHFFNELARISQESEAALQEAQECAEKYQHSINKIDHLSSTGIANLIELMKALPNPSELVVVDLSEITSVNLPILPSITLPDFSAFEQLVTKKEVLP